MVDILLLLLIIPLLTAVIGWFTNYVAVKMIFHPRHFVGLGPLGWQGILPRHASRFAAGVADTITEHLISPREIAERLDPADMEAHFATILDEELPQICHLAAEAMQPGVWGRMPEPQKQMIITHVRQECRGISNDLFSELSDLSNELLPLKSLVQEKLSGDNVGNLVALFQGAGKKEFKFIEIYGGVFGLLIGFVQAGLWSLMQLWWLMPIVGVVVGLVTNWLAIQMIFRPLEPKTYVGFITYQGMFPKRQAEISADYGRLVSRDVLSIRNLFHLITHGAAGVRVAAVVAKSVEPKIDAQLKVLGQMIAPHDDGSLRDKVKQIVIQRMVERAPKYQPEIEGYLEQQLDIENTLKERLSQLPKAEFERVLRGVFEEDELTLILCGGFLGGLVGVLQATLLLF